MRKLAGCIETLSVEGIGGWLEGEARLVNRCRLELQIDGNAKAELQLPGAPETAISDERNVCRHAFILDLPGAVSMASQIAIVEKNTNFKLPYSPKLQAEYKNMLKNIILHNLAGMDLLKQEAIIPLTGLFDAKWYLAAFSDIKEHPFYGKNPLRHWLEHGLGEGRNPSAKFDIEYYITKNKLAPAEASCNPILHYSFIGRHSGCKIHASARASSRPISSILNDRLIAERDKENFSNFTRAALNNPYFSPLANINEDYCDRGKISIITPFYNRKDTIRHAIQSALNQTYLNIELILIDDGSTDCPGDIFEPFLQDPRVKLARIPHAGASAARNAGLRAATGGYICFLDSDNIWNPRFLATMLEKMAADNALAAYCGMYRYIDNKFAYFFHSFNLDMILNENFIDLNSVIFHRSLLVDEYFDEALYRLNDWDFIIRIARKYEPAAYNFPGVAYFAMRRGDRISDSPVSQKLYIRNKHNPDIDWEMLRRKNRVPGFTSIIIPVSACSLYILECLESLEANTGMPCEIILVDSQADRRLTGELLNLLAGKSGIKYIQARGDYNWSAACNAGFANSIGEYACFMSGSFIATPGWLNELVAAINDNYSFAMPVCEDEGRYKCGSALSLFSPIPYPLFWNVDTLPCGDIQACASEGPCILERARDFINQQGFSTAFVETGAMLFHTLKMSEELGKCGIARAGSVVRIPGPDSHAAQDLGWDWHTFLKLKNFTSHANDVNAYAQYGLFPYEYEIAETRPACACRVPLVKKVRLADRRLLLKNDLTILVIKPSGIGNMLFTMPLLAALKKMFPHAAVDVLCFSEEAPIAAREARHVIAIGRTEDSICGWKKDFAAICGRLQYDIAILPPNTVDRNTPGVSQAAGIVICHPYVDWDSRHEAEHCMDLARMLGWQGGFEPWRYAVDTTAERLRGSAYIAAHTGASASPHMRKKLWPLEYWAAVLEAAANKYFIYLVEGPNEHELNSKLLSMLAGKTLAKVIIKKTDSLDDCANYLQYARAMVSVDGGIGHLANHIGVPTVMIFGPTSQVKGSPYCAFAPAIALAPDKGVTCAPCYPSSPERLLQCSHRKCLASIKPESVLRALAQLGLDIG